MADTCDLSGTPFFADLVIQIVRQSEAIERLGRAAESIATDLGTLLTARLTAALIRPWANDPRIVRVVLIQNSDDERRLRESLHRYESGGESVPMEEWLKKDGFRVMETKEIAAERHGLTTFKATTGKHLDLESAAAAAAPVLEHLELERKPD
jgi:hypothetical protein